MKLLESDLRLVIRKMIRERTDDPTTGFLGKMGKFIDTGLWDPKEENARNSRHEKLNVIVDATQDAYDDPEVKYDKLRFFLSDLHREMAVNKKVMESRHGRKAARASLHRKNRINASGSEMVEYEEWLQDKYGPYLDELDVGWNDEDNEWMVLDEVEGRYVPSGVSEKGPIGKMKAWDYVNGRDVKSHKASQKASQYYYG